MLTADDIREIAACPECGARRGDACRRSRESVPLPVKMTGTSHYARMIQAYRPRLSPDACREVATRSKTAPARASGAEYAAMLVDLAGCPRHGVPAGTECPAGGACPVRKRTAAAAAARTDSRRKAS